MSDILFYGQFVAAKVGATGLTVTIDVRKVERSSGTASTVVTGASAVEWWKGIYRYLLTGADLQTYDYVGVFITSDATVDQQEVPALWTRFSEAVTVDSAGAVTVAGLTPGNLDAAISTRLATSGYTAPPTVAAIRTELDANSTKLANLDAAISTRSTYAGADTAGTTTLLARLTAGRATGLDALDAAVSTRLAAADYTAPPATVTLAASQPSYAPAKAGDAMALTSNERTATADAVLTRDWTAISGVTSAPARCLLNALRFLRNHWRVVAASPTAGTLTVYKEDDTTTAWTKPVVIDASAAPITEVGP